ncbi:hypothetical protein J5283_04080 [Rhizobium sp. 16-488-2a]|nr:MULTISPECIES: hypothetical protein [unclassified Rhizobium]MBO9122802.1 hypothetical protein [Rhizobium sp. 16-488-2b]MBO9173334.1 hypothetical protein [Rhizobium sp. 16-488-2a]
MQEVVGRFGTSPHRRQLLRSLIAYRRLFAADSYDTGIQLLDGSFVENVEATAGRQPGDIDVFTLVAPPQKYVDDYSLWQSHGAGYWESQLVNRQLNKQRFSLDSYGIMIDSSMPIFDMLQNVTYWYGLFSHQRDTFQWKGFVAVDVNPFDDEAALLTMGDE